MLPRISPPASREGSRPETQGSIGTSGSILVGNYAREKAAVSFRRTHAEDTHVSPRAKMRRRSLPIGDTLARPQQQRPRSRPRGSKRGEHLCKKFLNDMDNASLEKKPFQATLDVIRSVLSRHDDVGQPPVLLCTALESILRLSGRPEWRKRMAQERIAPWLIQIIGRAKRAESLTESSTFAVTCAIYTLANLCHGSKHRMPEVRLIISEHIDLCMRDIIHNPAYMASFAINQTKQTSWLVELYMSREMFTDGGLPRMDTVATLALTSVAQAAFHLPQRQRVRLWSESFAEIFISCVLSNADSDMERVVPAARLCLQRLSQSDLQRIRQQGIQWKEVPGSEARKLLRELAERWDRAQNVQHQKMQLAAKSVTDVKDKTLEIDHRLKASSILSQIEIEGSSAGLDLPTGLDKVLKPCIHGGDRAFSSGQELMRVCDEVPSSKILQLAKVQEYIADSHVRDAEAQILICKRHIAQASVRIADIEKEHETRRDWMLKMLQIDADDSSPSIDNDSSDKSLEDSARELLKKWTLPDLPDEVPKGVTPSKLSLHQLKVIREYMREKLTMVQTHGRSTWRRLRVVQSLSIVAEKLDAASKAAARGKRAELSLLSTLAEAIASSEEIKFSQVEDERSELEDISRHRKDSALASLRDIYAMNRTRLYSLRKAVAAAERRVGEFRSYEVLHANVEVPAHIQKDRDDLPKMREELANVEEAYEASSMSLERTRVPFVCRE
eukprot:g117.t1